MSNKNKNNYVVGTNTDNSSTSANNVIAKSVSDEATTKVSNWYTFTLSFLLLSDIGCDNFLSTKIDSLDKSLALSIIFNLKHSLEIVMKTISYDVSGNNIAEIHDVQDLLQKLKDKIKKHKNAKKIKEHLDKFEKYLIKYCKLELFNNAFKTAITLNDKKNILFKYPETNGNLFIDINYSILINKITKSDIRDIKKDISEIRKILNELKKIIKDNDV